jgi:hypothetical protein
VQEGGQERPVGRSEVGSIDLALQDGELVAQRKDLDVHVQTLVGSSRTKANTLVNAR